MKPRLFLIAGIAALGLMSGGCSTTQTRIEHNLPAFSRATPTQQELIKQGKVALGFDAELVKLALGDPDRIRTRTDENGESIVWVYNIWESDTGVMLYSGYYHRWYGGPAFYTAFPLDHRHAREAMRVTFRDGKVISVETEN